MNEKNILDENIIAAEREAFLRAYQLPYGSINKLDAYAKILCDWQMRINLVAPSTLTHVWQRHFFDSAQLLSHIPPDAKTVVDIGSGAGFPGMVLALLGVENVHLIEATQKKAKFLCAVAEELNIPVTVHDKRVDEVKNLHADVMTARAVAPLAELLPLCRRFRQPGTLYLLLKGAKTEGELTEAGKAWHFDLKAVPSRSNADGQLLKITNLLHKREVTHDQKQNRRRRP